LPELGRAELENKLFMLEKELEKLRRQNEMYSQENERLQREQLEKGNFVSKRKDETTKVDRKIEKLQNELNEYEERYIEMQ